MTAAAFCPMTPLLFRHLSGGADAAGDLRAAAVAAVHDATDGAEAVTVLVPVDGREAPAAWWDPSGRVAGGRPLGSQVGEHLLELAGCTLPATYVACPGPVESRLAGVESRPADVESRLADVESRLAGASPIREAQLNEPGTALLVLGDGAACRRDGAPGYIDDRSFAYDDAVAAALGSGDTGALAGLDEALGAELLATGRLTWPVAAAVLAPVSAELRYRDDPYGLSWFVALWR
ncbi:hypothetical protein EKO23_20565 [Nocardioides guangzhouensis]|uniref:Uncharacterized protein n=1 Tax=Nocardioides guangzhouensis TaxID=2497878 RepID=A0A4Q4Z566_9ACTN|nr:hypothetical protein [Nocardioides guangzhouensis]RYP82910.1 hypothetical protein EKO23_20565 [Nocardioides guangzhouensis]